MRDKLELPAVKDRELEVILKQYELCEPLEKGKLQCGSCKKILSWENIGALKVTGKNLTLYCNNPECIEYASSKE